MRNTNPRKTDTSQNRTTQENLLMQAIEKNIVDNQSGLGEYGPKIDNIAEQCQRGEEIHEKNRATIRKLILDKEALNKSLTSISAQNVDYLQKIRDLEESIRSANDVNIKSRDEHIQRLSDMLNASQERNKGTLKLLEEKDNMIGAQDRLIGAFRIVLESQKVCIDKEGFKELAKEYDPQYRNPYFQFVDKMLAILHKIDEYRGSKEYNELGQVIYAKDYFSRNHFEDKCKTRAYFGYVNELLLFINSLFMMPTSEHKLTPEEVRLRLLESVKEQPRALVEKLEHETASLLKKMRDDEEAAEFGAKLEKSRPKLKSQETEVPQSTPDLD